MQVITNCAISYKGSRVPKGVELDLTVEEAMNYGTSVKPVEALLPEPTPEPEKALEDMTAAELKDVAAALGLSTSGSKADLFERITLHKSGTTTEEDVTNE